MRSTIPYTVDPDALSTIADAPGSLTIAFNCPQCMKSIRTQARTAAAVAYCPHCGGKVMTPVLDVGPGTVIDDFQLIRRVGSGAMGEVFVANQRSLSRVVAVKVMSPSLTSSPTQVERFRREVHNLGRLHHPNIVTAFYAGQHEGIHYLAMSYVDGEDLHSRIQRKGAFPEDEALSVLYKVGDALRYAWEEYGFLHRDIKPANIMVDVGGEVKLTDLGLSKFVFEDSQDTDGGKIFGTPHYMSPEQINDCAQVDFRSDMYALGVTLYHMLASHPPFDAPEVDDILNKQIKQPPPDIRVVRPRLSPGSEALLKRLLAKRAEDRYGSWEDMLQAVAEALRTIPCLPDVNWQPSPETQEVWLESMLNRRKQERNGMLVLGAVLLVATGLFIASRFTTPEDSRWAYGLHATARQVGLTEEHLAGTQDRMRRSTRWLTGGIGRWHQQRIEQRHRRQRAQRIRDVIEHLDERAREYLRVGDRETAAAIYTEYDGLWAEESFEARRDRAAIYLTRRPPPSETSTPEE